MNAEGKPRATTGLFVGVWIWLLVLTGLTVGMSTAPLGKIGAVVMVLLIAGAKSALVGAYFMHLRWERGRLYLLLPAITVVILVVVFWLTFTDVGVRYQE